MTVIERPFSDKCLADLLASNNANLKKEIDSLSDDQLLGNSHDYLVAYFLEKYTFESLSLGEEDPSARKQERCKISKCLHDPFERRMRGRYNVEVDGVRVSFAYPYYGNSDLFRCRASIFSLSGYPSIEVQKGYVILKSERPIYSNAEAPSGKEIATELNSQSESIRSGIEYLARDIAAYNSMLSSSIESALAKRENLSKKLSDLFVELEIPVEPKKNADGSIALRKKLRLESKSESPEANCHISDVIYEEILDIIRNCYATCERTPATYVGLDEEALRDLALVPLNCQYEGRATGETFRNKGKTDISIEEKNRAAFVAECKIWKGQKNFTAAIEQLLGYLTWRDSKTALLIFSRNKDFKGVLQAAKEALSEDDRCINLNEPRQNEFDCKYVFEGKPGDTTRIRIMAFDLYSS